jgi:carbonic anhydrase
MEASMTNGTMLPPGTCECCADMLRARFDRRRFLHLTAGAGLLAAFPALAFAAERNYEAMLLTCIDPRFPAPTLDYMKSRDMIGKYSQFTFAGAAIGVVAPAFKDWSKTFWDNLAASMELHHIPKVIAMDHRDCGAAKIAYGAEKVANPTVETETHKAALMEFRKQVGERHPQLKVETGLMALDGKVEMFS